MILLARDMCPAGGHEARATGSLHANLNPILRLLIKKRICIELAKVPWHLNLSTKEGIDALNHVLKTLDDLRAPLIGNYIDFLLFFLFILKYVFSLI